MLFQSNVPEKLLVVDDDTITRRNISFFLNGEGYEVVYTGDGTESDTGGIWETPWNGKNWVPLVQYNDATKTANIWFAQFKSQSFTVTVWYADGTSDTAPVGPPRLPR